MKILISGAGVAGTSLAFFLSQLNHNVTVIERSPTLRATGLQIDLRGAGITVLRLMGLEAAFRAKIAPEQGMQVVDKTGRRRAYFPVNKSGKGEQSFTTDFEIMRGDLCRLLHDAGKAHVTYLFDKSIASFEQNATAVTVHFADDTTDHFDLIVGADGVNSHTRTLLRGPDAPEAFVPLAGGVHVAYATLKRPIEPGEEYVATMFMAPGRRGIMTRRNSAHELQVYLGWTSPASLTAARATQEEYRAGLAAIFRGVGWRAEELVAALTLETTSAAAADFYCERIGLVQLDVWSQARVALVGDAAYCPSVNSGMGTTAALVGAYILAGEIGRAAGPYDTKDIAAALQAYEAKFRPFITQLHKGVAEEKSEWAGWATPFGVGLMNCLFGVASLLRINIGKYMLRGTVKDWNLPEYAPMRRE